jgi:hypothetical protein
MYLTLMKAVGLYFQILAVEVKLMFDSPMLEC